MLQADRHIVVTLKKYTLKMIENAKQFYRIRPRKRITYLSGH